MKKLRSLLTAFVAVCLASCSGEKMTPSSVEFKDGPLGNLVELVQKPYKLSYKKSVKAEVELRLKESMPHFQTLDKDEISLPDGPLALSLSDSQGNTLVELRLAASSYDDLKQLLKGKVGDTTTALFVSEEVDLSELEDLTTLSAGNALSAYPMAYNFEGGIGRNQIRMSIWEYDDNTIRGVYYYKKMGPNALLYLKGHRKDYNTAEIAEYNADGWNSGSFVGELKFDSYKGKFVANMNLRKYTFNFNRSETMEPIDFSTIDFSDFGNYQVHYYSPIKGYSNKTSGSVSRLLDKYERYINNYISIAKKAGNGDLSAIGDLTSLMEDITDVGEELERYEDSMSEADVLRFLKITSKLTSVAQ